MVLINTQKFTQAQSKSTSSKIKKGCQKTLSYLSKSVTKITSISKLCNISCKIIKFIQLVFGEDLFPVLNLVKMPFKAVKNLTSTLKLVDKTNGLIKINKKTPVLQIVHKVTSFVTTILKTVKYFGTLGILDLGKAAEAIGKIPVFGIVSKIPLGVVINVFQFVVSVLGAIDDVIEFLSLGKKIDTQKDGINKWSVRNNDIENLLSYLKDEAKLQSMISEEYDKQRINPDNFDNVVAPSREIQENSSGDDAIFNLASSYRDVQIPLKYGRIDIVGTAPSDTYSENGNDLEKTSVLDRLRVDIGLIQNAGEDQSLSNGQKKTPPTKTPVLSNLKDVKEDTLPLIPKEQNVSIERPNTHQTVNEPTNVIEEPSPVITGETEPKRPDVNPQDKGPQFLPPNSTTLDIDPTEVPSSTLSLAPEDNIKTSKKLSPSLTNIVMTEEMRLLQGRVQSQMNYIQQRSVVLTNHYKSKIETARNKIGQLDERIDQQKQQIDRLRVKVVKWDLLVKSVENNDVSQIEEIKSHFRSKIEEKNTHIDLIKKARIQRVLSLIYRVAKIILAASSVFLFFTGFGTIPVLTGFIALNVLTYSFGIAKFFWQETRGLKAKEQVKVENLKLVEKNEVKTKFKKRKQGNLKYRENRFLLPQKIRV